MSVGQRRGASAALLSRTNDVGRRAVEAAVVSLFTAVWRGWLAAAWRLIERNFAVGRHGDVEKGNVSALGERTVTFLVSPDGN